MFIAQRKFSRKPNKMLDSHHDFNLSAVTILIARAILIRFPEDKQ